MENERSELYVMELFSGIGGGILGHMLCGHRVVCAVELDTYCRSVLMRRQNDGVLPSFPIWDDIRTFDGRRWRGIVDVVSGGFPCQNVSPAGDRTGIHGTKSSLWFSMLRVVRQVRPRYVFVENSAQLVRNGLDVVLGGLVESGYDAEWCVLGASDVGAPHYRKRCWILAHANGRSAFPIRGGTGKTKTGTASNGTKKYSAGFTRRASADERGYSMLGLERQSCESSQRNNETDVPDTACDGLETPGSEFPATGSAGICAEISDTEDGGTVRRDRKFSTVETNGGSRSDYGGGTPEYGTREWWEVEPSIRRVVDGISHRLERLKGLGNAQVPLCAAVAWQFLYERSREK